MKLNGEVVNDKGEVIGRRRKVRVNEIKGNEYTSKKDKVSIEDNEDSAETAGKILNFTVNLSMWASLAGLIYLIIKTIRDLAIVG